MRNIERQMIAAVKGNINWSKDNTSVIFEDGISSVYLHGNLIAEVDDNSIKLYDGGYQTQTTKSRLNALLTELKTGCSVFQKNWNWYLCNDRKFVDFFDGMILLDTYSLEVA